MAAQAATLVGFSELPADTFTAGPTSGKHIIAANGREPPFVDLQPVQGFSALHAGENGSFLVLSDNGFGNAKNSSDYLLSIYDVKPDFRTADGGSGKIRINDITRLADPENHMPYPIIRGDRFLTGADLDPESFQIDVDGSLWIGEEFNPSLVHFSKEGILLAAPYQIEGLHSVDNPSGVGATLPRSRGFEGMAISADRTKLYPMLESALLNAEAGLNIYTFDLKSRQFENSNANQPGYRYLLDAAATAIGDFTLFSETEGLVIERDSKQGSEAIVKRIYKINFEQVDENRFLRKTLVVDLLDIDDPDDLNQDGQTSFSFPFWTIEGLVVIDRTTLAVANDNNYPLGPARETRADKADNTELILLRVDPLWD